VQLGKKMKSFMDRFQTKTRKKDANKLLLDEVKKYLTVERSKIEEAKLAEKLKAELNLKKPKKVKPGKPEVDPYERAKIKVNSTVKLIETKQSGTVEEINGEMVTVTFGFMRLKVERQKLMFIK
jgi:DNA mismatch repair protein MutS2